VHLVERGLFLVLAVLSLGWAVRSMKRMAG
jgi:hypothetical protein